MLNNLEHYQELYKACVAEKQAIIPQYNQIMEYTLPFGHADTIALPDDFINRTINSEIRDACNSFKNFVIYALFGVETDWAESDVIVPLVRQNRKFTGEALEETVKRLRKTLESQTKDTFEYLRNTNYKQEIGRGIYDWGELGTACYRINELNSDVDPFNFKYIPINELLFMEDYRGEPNIVFRKVYNKKPSEIQQIFPGTNIGGLEEKNKFTFTECVVPFDDNGTQRFEWILFNDDISEVYEERIYDYNPFTVYRFSVVPQSSWGMGIGAVALDCYQRLVFYENLRARQALRIVDPPLLLYGDKRLVQAFDLTPNGLNWGGDGLTIKAGVTPINTTGTLLPTEKDIDRLTATIQALHFNNPFGSAENKTTRATDEIQYRMNLLQQKFDDAVTNLFKEVLIPTFYKPREILLGKDLLERIDDNKYFKARFINALTKSVDMQKIEGIVNMVQISQGIFPQDAFFIFNTDKTIEYMADKLRIDTELLLTNQEREASKQSAVASSLQAQQMLGGTNGE